MTRRLASAALLLLAVLTVAAPAGAQGVGERITAYDVDIRVETSGDLLITEIIDYDFAANRRHGIFREIPVRLHYDSRYERVYPLKVISVEGSPGTPDQYKRESIGAKERLKIGDPDETITGAHRYTITYRVEGALNGFEAHDELYWNAIGTEWPVPIEQATVRVTTPADLTEVACFGGERGSALPCAQSERAGRTAGFSDRGLRAHDGLTVVVAFAKGSVPPPAPVLDERWSLTRAFSLTPATAGTSVVLLVAGVLGVMRLAWRTGRDRAFAGSPVDVAYATAGQ